MHSLNHNNYLFPVMMYPVINILEKKVLRDPERVWPAVRLFHTFHTCFSRPIPGDSISAPCKHTIVTCTHFRTFFGLPWLD